MNSAYREHESPSIWRGVSFQIKTAFFVGMLVLSVLAHQMPAQDGVAYQFGDLDLPVTDLAFYAPSVNQNVDGQAAYETDHGGLVNHHAPIVWFAGIEGSKQPQDFGVNANLGGRIEAAASGPLLESWGIGFQAGTAFVASGNAVQVFELLGESSGRIQSFSSVGIFQRTPRGFSWGFSYDYLFQESIDNLDLGQWRIRIAQEMGGSFEVGATAHLRDRSDSAQFNAQTVEIEPIESFSFFVRRYWQSGADTAIWMGQAAGHSEDNAVVGAQVRKENTLTFGADVYAPLNEYMAVRGEAHFVTPVDTGAVDAYLGIEFVPSRLAGVWRRARFRPLLPVASSATFTNDLRL